MGRRAGGVWSRLAASTPHDSPAIEARLWHLLVNRLAASPLVGPIGRASLYRRCGLDVGEATFQHSCYFAEPNISVGRDAYVNDGCYFDNPAKITIGERCGISHQVSIFTSHHEIALPERRDGRFRPAPVVIGDGTWVGARATILAGVTIAPGCLIAAGAVVTRDCERDGLYAGVPARRIRDLPTEADWKRDVVERIEELVAPGGAFAFVDDDLWDHRWGGNEVATARRAVPFPEGTDQGLVPLDDSSAITELERLRRHGVSHLVFAWPSFWWLDHYARFAEYVRARYRCERCDDRVIAFSLEPSRT